MNHVDHNTDPTFSVLNEIVRDRPGFSELVKTAQVGRDIRESLPVSAFADPGNRLFPIHTPADALLSFAYAEKQASVPTPITDKISRAVTVYGVTVPEAVSEKVAFQKVAYLIEDTRQLPIRSNEDVPKAEEALHRNSRKLRPSTLAKAANTLIKEASDRGLEVRAETLQYAGLTRCDLEKAAELIEARSIAAPAGRPFFDKLAGYVRGLDSGTTRSDLVTIADAVGQLDDNYKLARHYGRTLPNPMETVFNTKTAMGNSVDLAGRDVPLDSLLKVPKEAYGDLLGEDIVSELVGADQQLDPENVSAVLATLPLDMKQLLLDRLGL